MRLSILLMIWAVMVCVLFAKDMTIEEQRMAVRTGLSEIVPDDEKSLGTVETKLIENNDLTVDSFRLILKDKTADLSVLEADFDAATQDKVVLRRMRMEIDILFDTIINREWKINPRKLVNDWMVEQKDADGNPFEPEYQPRIVNTIISSKYFPDYVFYKVTFSPYPAPRVLPATLGEQNLFAVDKTGKVTYLPNPTALEKFWKNIAGPAKTDVEVKEAVSLWLTLSTQYSAFIALNFVNPKPEEVAITTEATTITGAGKSNIMNVINSVGTLTATLSFDTTTGKLLTVKEARFIRRGITYQISGVDGWY